MKLRLVIVALLCLAGCSGQPRPEAEQAKQEFQKIYPEAEIINVRLSEDEAIARSFEFTYRKQGESETKKIEIQYMESDAGPFEMRPKPPKVLP
jgi:PBP1b-binding outer membrane lipoprotein LpoB